jgi:hypothetical protein
MTAATTRPARSGPGPGPAARRPGLAAARLLRLELRHNAMLWLLPVVLALFWLTTYRKTLAQPPLWNPRAAGLQTGAVAVFTAPVAGAAAWMGTRDARRRVTDLVAVTARPRWARQLTTWAATTGWAIVGYLACLAAVYGVTAQHAHWGGPLWWPAAVPAATVAAVAALGFAAGTLLPSRFTAPVTAIAAFFVVALSTQLIVGSQSYWQVSPVVSGPWDQGSDPGVATFYPYVPDLAMAQLMFLAGVTVAVLGLLALAAGPGGRRLLRPAAAVTVAGVLAAGTAAGLAGTGTMDRHGMIAIPALHDAASDRPLRFTPVCSRTAIPVCLNPAYASYLPITAAALQPVLSQLAGLPGAPARISQVAAVYHQEAGNGVAIGLAGPPLTGTPPVYRLLLPDQLTDPSPTAQAWVSQLPFTAGLGIVASVIGDGPGASPAQNAVATAIMLAAGVRLAPPAPGNAPSADRARTPGSAPSRGGAPGRAGGAGPVSPGSAPPGGAPALAPGSPAYAAAQRFAGQPAATRHAWLVRHLAALRAGHVTLAQLP